jgi:hypothetical protein
MVQRGARFEGHHAKIEFHWQWLPDGQREPAKERIREILAPHLDLTDRPARLWSFEPNFRSVARWGLKVIGVIVGLTALALSPLLVVEPYLERDTTFGFWSRMMCMGFLLMVLYAPLFYYPHSAEGRRNRESSWRLRQTG